MSYETCNRDAALASTDQPPLQPCNLSSGDVLSCRVRCGALKWTRIRVSEHLAHAEAYGRGPLTARNVRALCTAAAGDRFRLLATIPELSEHAETGKSCIYEFGWIATLWPRLLCGPMDTAAGSMCARCLRASRCCPCSPALQPIKCSLSRSRSLTLRLMPNLKMNTHPVAPVRSANQRT